MQTSNNSVGIIMTDQLRDILMHILSDDPSPDIPGTDILPGEGDRELLTSFVQKRAVLQKKKNRMDAIFAHSPQPILILNPEARITEVNPSFLQISGFSLEACIGKPIQTIVPGFVLPGHGYNESRLDSEIFTLDFPHGRRILE